MRAAGDCAGGRDEEQEDINKPVRRISERTPDMVIGIYKTLITLVFPVLKVTYIRKRRRTGKEHPVRFNERLGLYKRPRPGAFDYGNDGDADVGGNYGQAPAAACVPPVYPV